MAEGGIRRSQLKTGSDPIFSTLYRNHSQASRNNVERASLEVCNIMTRLGYGEIRRRRSEKAREFAMSTNIRANEFTTITSGYKAEGLSCIFESDLDTLIVMKRILCVEAGTDLETIPCDTHVFIMRTREYPGHCRLIHERQPSRVNEVIYNALCDDKNGDTLLSSALFLHEFSSDRVKRPGVINYEVAGPSTPHSTLGLFFFDEVVALCCHCPSILNVWATRSRHWPSPSIVQKVESLGAYVTPIGFKGSEYKHLEWRICFNAGETEIVNNLNETQAKVYVMLKMILNDVLKPNNKETSYVLKNIIFWQAERNPQTLFTARSLLYWLHDGLRELQTVIAQKQLSYNMIPERNLIASCSMDDALHG
ncbi:hypothetical protein DPMN_037571 [Dreissena polymorpha]|uniref:Mab-21-like HhH/H2TH-like domain-containing protein n=1 Tax=Dreissena polymorpha TaxID=45954 RepID=A0A9D4MES5_DREPO|nr:hypothetical protein DPMN_037571 [Dreissena polymorpha]